MTRHDDRRLAATSRPDMPPLRALAAEARDRLTASDPGLGRLRLALSAVVCVGTGVPVQLLAGSLLGYARDDLVATTLFGAVVAMVASNALVSKSRSTIVRTATLFPPAIGTGLLASVLTSASRGLQAVGFVAVLFAAVWVRRFGPDWLFYGLMAWMGFFFATYLHATSAMLPLLLGSALISTVWVSALSATLFHTQGRRVLRSALTAYFARARAVARECADLLEVRPGHERARRRALRAVTAQRTGFAETGLLVDAWSADPDALPEGWSAPALRRRMIETQQSVDRFAEAVIAMTREGSSTEILETSSRALDQLARGQSLLAIVTVRRLEYLAEAARQANDPRWWRARHVAVGARDFLRLDATAEDAPEFDVVDEFEAVTDLVLGALPGASAVARDVPTRGTRWNPASRFSLTTRQAVQVSVAGLLTIPVATLLSPTHYYWALIAVFVTFTGTGTRTETLLRGYARVVGTLVGIGAALVIASVTEGRPAMVFTAILVSLFLAFYLTKISFTASTLFITILLGQLLTAIGTFSDDLLEIRLGETAVGALLGVLVAMVFAPLSTRDTVRAARAAMLAALEQLLRGVVTYVEEGRADLDGLVRALDDRARGLALVARPLSRAFVVGPPSRRTVQRLSLYSSAITQARALAVSLQRRPVAHPETTVEAAGALADATRAMQDTRSSGEVTGAAEPLGRSDVALFSNPAAARDGDPVLRHLYRLNGTLGQISEIPASAPL